ncbi:MAG: methyl-accepting chemotaxis protein [Desulfovibrio sp.]
MKIKLNVQGKLLLPILSIVLLGLMGLTVFMYLQSTSIVAEQIRGRAMREAESAAESLNLWIADRKRDARNWSENKLCYRVLLHEEEAYNDAATLLAGMLRDYDYCEAINLLDASGRVVASGNPERVGLDLSKRDYFMAAMQGEEVISKPLLSAVRKKPIIVLAEPVKSPEGLVVGVFTSVLRIDSATSAITDRIKIGSSGYAYVVDGGGLVISHPDAALVLKEDTSKTEFGRQLLQDKVGVQKYWYAAQSQWKLMSYHDVPATGWIVAVTAPLDELKEPLIRMRDIALLGCVFALFLVGVVIFLSVARVTKIIKAASAHLTLLSTGNLDSDVPEGFLKGGDELGDLARGFQVLVESQRVRVELAQSIAAGDLTHEVEISSNDDRLGIALDEMVSRLNDIMGQIGAAAEQVQSGSGQVSESSQALSQGATEQASSLEEITSSVTEISSQTRTNAENASQASRLASQARDAATEGDREMKNMVAAMQDINQSSQAISKIIKVIDEIAFQTNLLALNAAVEAARAGQHGKGFAVVAEEVRNLASRSAKAAQETAQLIEGSVVKVGKGSEIAAQTAESLQQIVDKAARVADLVAEIAAASDEQAKGVNQINIGLGQIDQVTQQNTANAEETASASEELSSQAVEMRRLVGRFRLHRNEMRAVNAPRLALVNRNGNRAPQLPPSTSSSPSSASGRKEEKPRAQAQARQVRSTASARPASEGAWAAGGNQNGAGGAAKSAAEVIRPEDVIALDDDEFGRY